MTEDRNSKGQFAEGNSQRFGTGKKKDKTRGKGNPAATISITACLNKLINEDIPKGHKFHIKYKGKKWSRALAERMLEFALTKGNPALIKEILDRCDGTVAQLHEIGITKTIVEFVEAEQPKEKK